MWPFDDPCHQSCQGAAEAFFGGGTGPYSVDFSDGISNDVDGVSAGVQVAINLCAGTYTVLVTDDLGGTATAEFTITEPAELTQTVTTTPESSIGTTDGTATTVATGGTSPYYYNWSNGDSQAAITGLTTASYCVTTSDLNACSATHCETVNITTSIQKAERLTTIRSVGKNLIIDSKRGSVDVYSISGKKVKTANLVNGRNTVSVRDQGIYLVRVNVEGRTTTKKLHVSGNY